MKVRLRLIIIIRTRAAPETGRVFSPAIVRIFPARKERLSAFTAPGLIPERTVPLPNLTRADYVSCPSCGRTLYNIQEATARIRKATEHLKGVKIAVMGCIVNGPGEMADADFGYVGGAPNKINLYVKHTPVKFNIPQEEAVERLVDLIKEYGRWVDPK